MTPTGTLIETGYHVSWVFHSTTYSSRTCNVERKNFTRENLGLRSLRVLRCVTPSPSLWWPVVGIDSRVDPRSRSSLTVSTLALIKPGRLKGVRGRLGYFSSSWRVSMVSLYSSLCNNNTIRWLKILPNKVSLSMEIVLFTPSLLNTLKGSQCFIHLIYI